MRTTIKLKTVKCLRCGHVWVPRVSEVRACGSCKSHYWDIPRKERV